MEVGLRTAPSLKAGDLSCAWWAWRQAHSALDSAPAVRL